MQPTNSIQTVSPIASAEALNTPTWLLKPEEPGKTASQPQGPLQESWYLSVRDTASNIALDLKFGVLISNNGFQRIAENRGMFFQKGGGKVLVRENFDLSKFSHNGTIKIAECELTENQTRGRIQSKGQSIAWNLRFEPRQSPVFDLIPSTLKKTALLRNLRVTPHPDLSFNGTITVNGQEFRLDRAPGSQGHQSGNRENHSWISGHSNVFLNQQGVPVPFVFEGISLRGFIIGSVPSPRVSSFYFLHQGKLHYFNSIRDAVRMQSKYTLNEWSFRAERGDLAFQGRAAFDLKDFAGVASEDTNGSIVYSSTSKFSNLEIHVYEKGKLKSALISDRCASIEIASRKKNPYVPIQL